MLYFFRKIRKALFTEGKLWQYVLYALGEIVLVVIGILIALQIDNANEEKKSRDFEQEILNQVYVNLTKDKESLEQIALNFEKAIRSSGRILEAVEDFQPNDSLKYWLGDVVQFDRFQPLTYAYEQLKAKGFDHIENRQLRFLLGAYYDDVAEHTIKSIEDLEYAFNTEWVPVIKAGVVNFVFKQELELENFDVLKPDQLAGKILMLNKDNYRGGLFRIKVCLETIDKLQTKIEEELES